MQAVAYPAALENGTVRTLTQRAVHTDSWPNWVFKSNRSVARRFQRGLAPRYLNEGAYFRILLYREDYKKPRYELNVLYTQGVLHVVN